MRRFLIGIAASLALLGAEPALAQGGDAVRLPAADSFVPSTTSGRLLLTGGVTMFEGASGGGLVPWATIGGYGTRDEIGATAFGTFIPLRDYRATSYGALAGFYNRVELSYARAEFNTQRVGGDLGLGRDFTFGQDVFGVKVRLFGDLVLDQDSLLPQVAVGAQYRQNNRSDVVRAVGAERDADWDFYVSATKLFLSQSLLVNGTLRATRANEFGFLGFGGARNDDYQIMPEVSVAYLVNRNLAVGAEYRRRPLNLDVSTSRDAYDFFVAYAVSKNVSVTLAYVDLGEIVAAAAPRSQRGAYLSLNIGF
jgi:hypothetical protein